MSCVLLCAAFGSRGRHSAPVLGEGHKEAPQIRVAAPPLGQMRVQGEAEALAIRNILVDGQRGIAVADSEVATRPQAEPDDGPGRPLTIGQLAGGIVVNPVVVEGMHHLVSQNVAQSGREPGQ